jgi:hypothetical protein
MAGKDGDKNYVSVGFWMLALLVMTIPVIGLIMVIVWAFAGENESRKNYFRALIAWFCIIFVVLGIGLLALGCWPEIVKQLQLWMHQSKH